MRATDRLRMWAAGLALASCVLAASCRQAGAPAAVIGAVEAIHLVEAHVPKLTATAANLGEEDGRPAWVVTGRAEGAEYRAVVEARVARVVRVEKNGQPFYEWPGIVAVGHRGTVHQAPENTLAAIRKAIEFGVDLIEIDVRETADGHLVILHDATVDRTTDGTGPVAELTLEQVKKLDAGSWFGVEFAGERIPTLDEALEAMKGRALPDIDFKAGTPEKLVETLRRHGLLGKVTLYCGDWTLLRKTVEVSREFLLRPTAPDGRLGLSLLVREFDPPIVNINWEELSETLIRDVHMAGRKAFVNTMGPNDTEFGIAQAIEAGADYIQSDHPEVLMRVLRERGLHR